MSNLSNNKVIVVAGPTASGKTRYAIELAQKINGVIINADSRQVYKYMDIGTNKGNLMMNNEGRLLVERGGEEYELSSFEMEKSGIDGWLFDIVEPNDYFSLYSYQYLASYLIKSIFEQGRQPLLVGGTGLYIDSIVNNYQIEQLEVDFEYRQKLENLSLSELQSLLLGQNSKVFDDLNNSDLNNPVRLIRLIEKLRNSSRLEGGKKKTSRFGSEIHYPEYDRELLYNKIDKRVEEMFDEGLIEEVESLIKNGYKDCRSMRGIGYKEVAEYLEGGNSLEECKNLIKQGHRNYARRQITWFEGEGRGYELVRSWVVKR